MLDVVQVQLIQQHDHNNHIEQHYFQKKRIFIIEINLQYLRN